jgi:hypothetical protein
MRKLPFPRRPHHSSAWFKTAAMAWHGLLEDLFNPYRPELHYMRGPGPKWREKHRIPRTVD